MIVRARPRVSRLPPVRSIVRGLAHQSRLAVASRLAGWAPVQRRMADRSIAMMLHWYDPVEDPAADLHAAERSYWSHHGEDGLLDALLERVGAPTHTFVEIGASDGEENCTRALAERGWRGFWFEADAERVADAQKVAAELDVTVTAAMATSANVVELLRGAGVEAEPDVLVLDIDGNDFWVVRSLLSAFAPRVLVLEYNSSFPPAVFWRRRNRRNARWDETYRHGASLEALAWVAGRAGYQLVACDSTGAHAFFVRGDVADAAGIAPAPLYENYRPLLIAPPALGHPWRLEPDCPTLSGEELGRLHVVDAQLVARRPLGPLGTDQLVSVRITVQNRTGKRLTSAGVTPVRISAHLLDRDGEVVEFDSERHFIHGGFPPGRRVAAGGVFAIRDPNVTTLRICLVQEGIGWAEAGGFDLAI